MGSQLDSARVAGLIVIGAVVVLSAMRRGFAGVSVHVGG
jgi:hypothetical protein